MPFLTLLAITLISLSVVSRATCFIIGRKQGVYKNCYPKNQSLDHNPTSRLRKLKANPEPWSCIATLDSERDGDDVGIQFVGNSEISSQNGMRYSLSSPREWMEAIEAQHGRHGAYTVMRCDLKSNSKLDENGMGAVRVWGKQFHLDRISSSYQKMTFSTTSKTKAASTSAASIAIADDESKAIIDAIITHARKVLTFEGSADQVKVIMITLLWQSQNTNHPNDILVRGHAFCTNLSSIPTEYDPIPTMATIAIPKNESTQLPSRYNHMPKAKLSSWCSERRPIEQEFKIPDTGEIILSRSSELKQVKTFELLEGLTSNLFVVYSDGTIRTPSDAVLDGFARQLVMASAERHGLQVSNDPITLEDAKNGLWAEVFLTSSIRIIIPVGNVMIPDYTKEGEVTFKQIWSESPLSTIPWKLRRWKLLYEDIIHFINIP